MAENERLLDSLRDLANLLLSEETLESSLHRVAHLSVRAIDSCDAAGVSVIDGSEVVTAAGSDASVELIDQIQYSLNQGPCLQAMSDGRIFKIDSMADETRWPEFSSQAIDRGLTGCLSLPLIEDGETYGSLNLYSTSGHVFGADDEKSGTALAAQASGPLSNMRRYEELRRIASELSVTLDSRVALATGILIERHRCSRDEAMTMLLELAEEQGIGLEKAALSVTESVPHRAQ